MKRLIIVILLIALAIPMLMAITGSGNRAVTVDGRFTRFCNNTKWGPIELSSPGPYMIKVMGHINHTGNGKGNDLLASSSGITDDFGKLRIQIQIPKNSIPTHIVVYRIMGPVYMEYDIISDFAIFRWVAGCTCPVIPLIIIDPSPIPIGCIINP